MPIPTVGYAAHDASGVMQLWKYEQRDVGPNDVHIRVVACGVCATDVHFGKNGTGTTIYPMVPGHEIAGTVVATGQNVTKFKSGDKAGVGILADCCRTCKECTHDLEQYCSSRVLSVSGRNRSGQLLYGGYARDIVVEEKFVSRFPENLDLYEGAALLCAGISVYSPMKKFGMDKPGKKLGVIGLGGLGHMAVKFGLAFGLEVTVLSHSENKRADALGVLGAKNFINTKDPEAVKEAKGSLDFIIDTVGAKKDINVYLSLLDIDGALVAVAIPDHGAETIINPMLLMMNRRTYAGSVIGSIKETEEMLEFCAANNVAAMIEKVPMDYVNKAWERMDKSDVRYRFVLDIENSCPKV